MSQVTTHILDTAMGKPAADVRIILFAQNDTEWMEIAAGVTDHNGRASGLLAEQILLDPGTYKIKFFTKEYFALVSTKTFYPFIEVIFEITNQEHYHIPLLLNPFGYTTYRGS